MNSDSFDSQYLTLRKENSILFIKFKEDLNANLGIAREMVGQRLSFIGDMEYPTLVDTRKVKFVSKEARDYFAKGDGIKGVTALAILTDNLISALTANLFITFSKPTIPTRIFKNEKTAIEWLSQFVKKGN